MVQAAGGLLGWAGAGFWYAAPRGRRRGSGSPALLRTWSPTPASPAPEPPAWVARLRPADLRDARVLLAPTRGRGTAGSTAGTERADEGSAVVVPVRHDDETVGFLAFHGPQLQEPDERQLALLEAIATMLGRNAAPPAATAPRTAPAPAPRHASPLERAIALVDVFAFTVKVVDQGEVEWTYFGPNSQAVFGQPVSDQESLPGLMGRHVHHEDLLLVYEFTNAVVAGRRMEIEARMHGVDGTTRWISWRVVPRREKGVLHVDGVATDVSARHSLGSSRHELEQVHEQWSRELVVRREHAIALRDANDNVLQRLFAAGLRLQMLQRRLDTTDAHAASAIAFQLDQAANDLRELIVNLGTVIDEIPEPPSS